MLAKALSIETILTDLGKNSPDSALEVSNDAEDIGQACTFLHHRDWSCIGDETTDGQDGYKESRGEHDYNAKGAGSGRCLIERDLIRSPFIPFSRWVKNINSGEQAHCKSAIITRPFVTVQHVDDYERRACKGYVASSPEIRSGFPYQVLYDLRGLEGFP